MSPPSVLLFSVATGSSEPIYRQLVEQITRLIAGTTLEAGQTLPSVREMASHLAVNPMTVSKAYSLLEADGVLERRRGIGMIVAGRNSTIRRHDDRAALLLPTMEKLVFEARQLELDPDTVLTLLSNLLKGRL